MLALRIIAVGAWVVWFASPSVLTALVVVVATAVLAAFALLLAWRIRYRSRTMAQLQLAAWTLILAAMVLWFADKWYDIPTLGTFGCGAMLVGLLLSWWPTEKGR